MILLLQVRNGKLHQTISTSNEPAIKNGSQEERLNASFLEFVKACFGSQCCHCHGQEESIQLVNPIHYAFWKQTKRIESNHYQEENGKPWNADFRLVGISIFQTVSFGNIPCNGLCNYQKYRYQHHHPYHLHNDGIVAHLGSHGIGCTYHMGYFMNGGTRKESHHIW